MDEAAAAACVQAMTIGDGRCGGSAGAVDSGNVESTDTHESTDDVVSMEGAGEPLQHAIKLVNCAHPITLTLTLTRDPTLPDPQPHRSLDPNPSPYPSL